MICDDSVIRNICMDNNMILEDGLERHSYPIFILNIRKNICCQYSEYSTIYVYIYRICRRNPATTTIPNHNQQRNNAPDRGVNNEKVYHTLKCVSRPHRKTYSTFDYSLGLGTSKIYAYCTCARWFSVGGRLGFRGIWVSYYLVKHATERINLSGCEYIHPSRLWRTCDVMRTVRHHS